MMKKYFLSAITAAIVVSLVLITGCILSTANNMPNQTSTPSTAASHDAFLEKYVNRIHNFTQKNLNLMAWDENWLNSTTVSLIYTTENKDSHAAVFNQNMTIMHFNSTDDATAYFNSLNMTGYILFQNVYPGGTYQDITGHAPVPYKYYIKEDTSALQKSYRILMEDIVTVGESTGL